MHVSGTTKGKTATVSVVVEESTKNLTSSLRLANVCPLYLRRRTVMSTLVHIHTPSRQTPPALSISKKAMATSVSVNFRIDPLSAIDSIKKSLVRVEALQNVPRGDSLRRIAKGIDQFIELTRKDLRGCLEIEAWFGLKEFDTSDTTDLVTAGCMFIFSFHGFKNMSKHETYLDSLGELIGISTELIERASDVDKCRSLDANETLNLMH